MHDPPQSDSSETPTEAGTNAAPRESARAASLARGVEVGRYVVLDRIGAGAMGVVHAAFDPKLDRKIALKVLRNPDARTADAHGRLVREAKALARLSHPNVVAVHDVGEVDGRLFIAMEFVEGQTLRAWLAAKRPWREIVEVFVAAGRGLAAAHEHGLVHRDFKPDNAMIGGDGRVRVMDFGLALTSEETSQTPAVGTPAYMAPEQHRREAVGARADQFALCVALYEALYGERPFGGTTVHEIGAGMLRGELRRPPRGTRVPARIFRAIARGLSIAPVRRWPTMNALLDALHDRGARRRWIVALTLVFVALVGGALAVEHLDERRRIAACVEAGASITEVWNDDARARIRAGLAAAKHPLADDAYMRAEPWLDRYAADWSAERDRACRLVTVESRRTEDLAARADECLEERRDRLAALVELFAEADAPVVVKAVAMAAGLPGFSPCHDDVVLGLRAPPVTGDERDAARRHRQRLARIRSLVEGEAQRSVLAEVEALTTEVEALESTTLLAESRVALGWLLFGRGEFAAAAPNLREGLKLAGGLGNDALAAEASLGLARISVATTSELDVALQHTELAEMFLTRLGPGVEEQWANVYSTRAAVYAFYSRYIEALADEEKALEIRERLYGPTHPFTARTLIRVGELRMELGDLDAAADDWERAFGILESRFGGDHPQVAEAFTAIGLIAFANGAFEDAGYAFERCYEITARVEGQQYATGAATTNIAVYHLYAGSFGQALVVAEIAYDELSKKRGPADARVLEALITQCRAHFELGDRFQALDCFERAYAIREAAIGVDHPRLGRTLAYIGQTRLALGDTKAALADLERAVVLLERRVAAPEMIAMAQFDRARAIWITGGDPAAAIASARAARRGFVRAGGWRDRDVDRVDAWLVEVAGVPWAEITAE